MILPIKIVNKRHGASGEYVGRPSPLGNPWRAGDELTREEAISKYKTWLNLQWKTGNTAVINELKRLARKLEEDKSLTLVCWCVSKACHANVIADAIKAIIEKDLNQ